MMGLVTDMISLLKANRTIHRLRETTAWAATVPPNNNQALEGSSVSRRFDAHQRWLFRLCLYAHTRLSEALMMQKILTALAEPTRRAGLRLLWDSKEHCLCELMERLEASQSRMSRHMKALADAGLVTGRRDAQWVRYKRCPEISKEVSAFIEALWIAEDAEQGKTR